MNEQTTTAYAAPISQQTRASYNPSNFSYTLGLALSAVGAIGLLRLIKVFSGAPDLYPDPETFPVMSMVAMLLLMFAMSIALGACFCGVVEIVSSLVKFKPVKLGKVILGLSIIIVPLMIEARRPTPNQMKSRDLNNLRQIGLAMLNYESGRLYYPPVSGSSCHEIKAKGKGLSWRVHILPFLECEDLYERFHMDEPWDSPHNLSLIPEMPDIYLSHSVDENVPRGKTLYLRPVGNGALMAGDGKPVRFGDIADGASNTVMVLQANASAAVEWTRPVDLQFFPGNPKRALGNHSYGQILLVTCDGATHCFHNELSKEDLKALITRDGGEEFDAYRL